ncbi:SDR family NAD(P)-dependent oxidoreductase [Pendulispora albinea]|uniref:SDR family oxidoreductase n=1 Tax=Pendulispora albinea TaxID=2741071 RepID=A0ABZ2M394_9BACT
MDWNGRGVVITGASRGLGERLARWFAKRGAQVALVARGREELERVTASIVAEGGRAHAIAADVGDKEAIYGIAGAAAELVGPIDVVVHAASSLGPLPMPLLLDTACEDLLAVLETNLLGPFRLTKALAGPMVLRGRGVVVFVSSDAAVNGYPRWGAYGVSKAAQDHLGRIWAAELEGTGVQFLSIDPGDMNTKMHRDAIPDADPATLLDPAVVAARIGTILAHRHRIPSGTRLEARTAAADDEHANENKDANAKKNENERSSV